MVDSTQCLEPRTDDDGGGYNAGYAQVYYGWSATEDCVDQGSGAFSQPTATVHVVGTIPAGKTNVSVSLDAESVDRHPALRWT